MYFGLPDQKYLEWNSNHQPSTFKPTATHWAIGRRLLNVFVFSILSLYCQVFWCVLTPPTVACFNNSLSSSGIGIYITSESWDWSDRESTTPLMTLLQLSYSQSFPCPSIEQHGRHTTKLVHGAIRWGYFSQSTQILESLKTPSIVSSTTGMVDYKMGSITSRTSWRAWLCIKISSLKECG